VACLDDKKMIFKPPLTKSTSMFIETITHDDDKYSKIEDELEYISMVCWALILFIILLIAALSIVMS